MEGAHVGGGEGGIAMAGIGGVGALAAVLVVIADKVLGIL